MFAAATRGAGGLSGCNAGMAAEGGSPEEVKAAFDAQPLDVRARQVMSSPAPMDYKIQRVKDMYQKEGKEVPADILQGGGSGMPAAAPKKP